MKMKTKYRKRQILLYISSDDDGKVHMMLSDPESDYKGSFDGVDVGGVPADASTLKSRDDKES